MWREEKMKKEKLNFSEYSSENENREAREKIGKKNGGTLKNGSNASSSPDRFILRACMAGGGKNWRLGLENRIGQRGPAFFRLLVRTGSYDASYICQCPHGRVHQWHRGNRLSHGEGGEVEAQKTDRIDRGIESDSGMGEFHTFNRP